MSVLFPAGHSFKYSTEEQWTGDYWIDGKKIYRRTYGGLNFTIRTNWTATGISNQNIDAVVSAWTVNSGGALLYVSASPMANSTQISIASSFTPYLSGSFFSLTLEYTKTTD